MKTIKKNFFFDEVNPNKTNKQPTTFSIHSQSLLAVRLRDVLMPLFSVPPFFLTDSDLFVFFKQLLAQLFEILNFLPVSQYLSFSVPFLLFLSNKALLSFPVTIIFSFGYPPLAQDPTPPPPLQIRLPNSRVIYFVLK